MTSLVISFESCRNQNSSHCGDCLVTHLCDRRERPLREAAVLDFEEARAVRLLARAGLVPELAHRAV